MKDKIAIFDIDGTIALKGKVPQEVVEGVKHLHSIGYYTTVSTGRGYRRMRDTLGEAFDIIISDDSLISVEHGSKIVNKNGKVIHADYLKENELEHIVDFITANEGIVSYLWFIDPDPNRKYQIWCKEEAMVAKEIEERGHYADVFHCTELELLARLKEQPLSCVTCKLEDVIKVENLKLHFTKSDIDEIFQDGMMDFVRNVIDKSKAINFILDNLHIPHSKILVAGNAVNDVEMLNLVAAHRILVGDNEDSEIVFRNLINKENVIRVATPTELGEYLSQIKYDNN